MFFASIDNLDMHRITYCYGITQRSRVYFEMRDEVGIRDVLVDLNRLVPLVNNLRFVLNRHAILANKTTMAVVIA